MGEFDEFIRTEPEEVPKEEPKVRATSPSGSNTQLNKSLTEMILGESSPHQFAEKFGLDEEMTQKVLVPLLNFLDKLCLIVLSHEAMRHYFRWPH